MSTAKSLVTRSLRILNLENNNIEEDPYIQQVGFEGLVDLLNLLRGKGLYITKQIPPTAGSEVAEPPWSKTGLIYELAYLIAAPLQVNEFPPTFGEMRDKAYTTLYVNAKEPTNQQYPSTLPIGGGNEGFWDTWRERFYGRQDRANYQVYAEQNKNEKAFYVADFDADATRRATTVASVKWEKIEGSSMQISDISTSGNLSTALITFINSGTVAFKCVATYANNEVQEFLFKVAVHDTSMGALA